jgi:DtxR family transcriptional regulator, Mn-dependent transcriptional regulator
MAEENREEYLEAIYGLLEDGKDASTSEIAAAVGVKAGSVSEMLKKLHGEGYIRHRPYRGVELTDSGLRVASAVKRKHRLLERFLYDVLKIRKDRVHEEACRMEHSLSDEAANALDKLMKHPKECPDDHKPIPSPGGHLALQSKLTHRKAGDTVIVAAIEGGHDFRNRMMALGIIEGRKLRVVAVEPFGGPIVVKSGNTRVTVGRGMASKIRVVG